MLFDGPLEPDAVRGLLVTVDELGIGVIHARDPTDSAAWIARIAVRRRGDRRVLDRPHYAQRPKRDPYGSPPERALAAAAGVSTVTARRLLVEFGSLTNVLLAEPEELRRVHGVGVHRAHSIHDLATSTSDSGVSRNCERPAT